MTHMYNRIPYILKKTLEINIFCKITTMTYHHYLKGFDAFSDLFVWLNFAVLLERSRIDDSLTHMLLCFWLAKPHWPLSLC